MKAFDDDKIDDFLLGRMSETELKEFKKLQSMNKEFASRVRQRQENLQYVDLLGDLALKERVKRLHKNAVKNLPAEKRFNIIPFLKYAAVIIFIITAGLWFMQGPISGQDVFNNNYQAYELNFGDRGNNLEDITISAGQLYADGDYKKAIDLFNTIPDNQTNAKARLAKGISYLEIADFKNADIAFQKLIDDKDPIYEDHAKWYLAMSYFKSGNDAGAKILIQEIVNKPGRFNHQKAKDILEKI